MLLLQPLLFGTRADLPIMHVSTIIFWFRFCHEQYMLEKKTVLNRKCERIEILNSSRIVQTLLVGHRSPSPPPSPRCHSISVLASLLSSHPSFAAQFISTQFLCSVLLASLHPDLHVTLSACGWQWTPAAREYQVRASATLERCRGAVRRPGLDMCRWNCSLIFERALKALALKVCPTTVTAHHANMWNVMLTPNYVTLSERRGTIAKAIDSNTMPINFC